jgi:ABC-2 type transport system permease protein
VGSTASRQEDIQTITGPLIILSVAGYLVSFAALNAPDAPWVRLLSFFPFFSPYLFPIRMVLGSVAPWEIVVALAILAAGVAVAIWVAGRIYSAGVLLYGQKTGLRAVWRAVRVNR